MPQGLLKKRLASRLAPKTAYDLLQACKAADIRESTFYLHLSTYVEITAAEKEQVLQEIRSIYRQDHITDGESVYIHELQIIMPAKATITPIDQNKMENSLLPVGMWGKVREKLIEIYGRGIDYHWFSKLEFVEDKDKSELKLKAPNSFVRDWIDANYIYTIESIIANKQYKVSLL